MTDLQNEQLHLTDIPQMLADYEKYLRNEERSFNTITKYLRDIKSFLTFTENNVLTKEILLEWKKQLTTNYTPSSVNSMLSAINNFLVWMGAFAFRIKPLKIQREIFSRPEKELSREEYLRLVAAADKKHNRRLSLLLQTICATGIRVSELRYITVEAMRTGRGRVDCKGKTRTIFLPSELCRMLCRYCKDLGIEEGTIFRTRNGQPLDRSNIWHDMKSLCEAAGVNPEKVFPHNLRHLFARTYYSLEKDLSRLADLLGHTNVSTTRIYTMENGMEHARQIEKMGLLLT